MPRDSLQQPARRRALGTIGAIGGGMLGALNVDAFAKNDAAAPALETVATFGDDFRLVGIGVSKAGRVFASAPGDRTLYAARARGLAAAPLWASVKYLIRIPK